MIWLQSFWINFIKKSALRGFGLEGFWIARTIYLINFGVPKMGFWFFFWGLSREGCWCYSYFLMLFCLLNLAWNYHFAQTDEATDISFFRDASKIKKEKLREKGGCRGRKKTLHYESKKKKMKKSVKHEITFRKMQFFSIWDRKVKLYFQWFTRVKHDNIMPELKWMMGSNTWRILDRSHLVLPWIKFYQNKYETYQGVQTVGILSNNWK